MGKHVIRILALLVILAGLLLLLYPLASRYGAAYNSNKVLRQFEEEAADAAASPVGTAGDGGDQKSGEEGTLLDQLFEDLQTYNERLFEEGQAGLHDPFDYETASFDLTAYGFSENVIGTLWIPRMEVELPIYMGANKENMAKGAALLGQTSMPLGGGNTNTVLAAHRGYRGIPMFRNIQKLQIGDKIQITTPWDTLVYRVCEIKIVTPEDSSQIFIQPGRDLVTLITCHPYTKNYQRYLVFAERAEDEEEKSHEEDLEEAAASYSGESRQAEVIDGEGAVSLTEISPESIRPALGEGNFGFGADGAAYSNLQIWLENHVTAIAFGLIAFVIIVMSIRRCRAAKKKQ